MLLHEAALKIRDMFVINDNVDDRFHICMVIVVADLKQTAMQGTFFSVFLWLK